MYLNLEANMTTSITILSVFLLSICGTCPAPSQQQARSRPASQNPSPMVEHTRKHERIPEGSSKGVTFEISGLFSRPVQIFIPAKHERARSFDLLIHFHGAGYVVQHAASKYRGPIIAATVNLGSGSKVYSDGFEDTTKFVRLIDSILDSSERRLRHAISLRRIILSGFSAGYGAIRRIIGTESNYAGIDGVLLLDGIHAGYIPEQTVVHEGGVIDSTDLLPFLKLAGDASGERSKKRFLITHSEIFPGTFVSTTEATDYLLRSLQLRREPLLKWGPLGMQQLSQAKRNNFAVRGYAGNTAPDHIDHFHGLFRFLNDLLTF